VCIAKKLSSYVVVVRVVTQATSSPAVNVDLFKAAETGNIAEMARLTKSGCSVSLEDKSGRTALLYAARGGQLAAVEWLASQGAELDAMDKVRCRFCAASPM
jgi:uncharacterized protein